MRVIRLAQEHKTMSPARARTRTARSGDERTNHEATAPRSITRSFTFSIRVLQALVAQSLERENKSRVRGPIKSTSSQRFWIVFIMGSFPSFHDVDKSYFQ